MHTHTFAKLNKLCVVIQQVTLHIQPRRVSSMGLGVLEHPPAL